jgi:hypothetical protein
MDELMNFRKMRNKILAVLLVLGLVVLLAACGEKKPEPTTTTAAATTTEPLTEYAAANVPDPVTTTSAEVTSDPAATTLATETTTADATAVSGAVSTTAAPESNLKPGETTIAATKKPVVPAAASTKAAAKAPSTKAEIVAYFNAAANKVKTDKPGMSWKDHTIIYKDQVQCESRMLNSIAPSVIGMFESTYSGWSEHDPAAKGGSHNEFPVSGKDWASKLDANAVSSATCKDNGSTYSIRINMKDETMSQLPADPTTTAHGKVMRVFSRQEIADGIASAKVINVPSFGADYAGSYIDCTVDKATGRVKSATYFTKFVMKLDVATLGIGDVAVPIAQEAVYTVN